MRDLFIEPFRVPFMRRALVEVVLLGVLGGVVGVHVLLRRLAFVTEVVQHTVFPGIAIAFAFGQSLLVGARSPRRGRRWCCSTLLSRQRRIDPDAAMAVLHRHVLRPRRGDRRRRRRGYQSDLTALLFGRILAVDERQVDRHRRSSPSPASWCWPLLHKELVLRAFDPAGAEALGYPVARLDLRARRGHRPRRRGRRCAPSAPCWWSPFIVTPAAAGPPAVPAHRLDDGRRRGDRRARCGWLGLVVSYERSVDHDVRLAPGATIVVVLTGRVRPRRRRHGACAGRPRPAADRPGVRRRRREQPGRQLRVAAVPPGAARGGARRRCWPAWSACTSCCGGCRSSSWPCRTPRSPAWCMASVLGFSLFLGGAAFGLVVVAAVRRARRQAGARRHRGDRRRPGRQLRPRRADPVGAAAAVARTCRRSSSGSVLTVTRGRRR